jgi:hypothetical protein
MGVQAEEEQIQRRRHSNNDTSFVEYLVIACAPRDASPHITVPNSSPNDQYGVNSACRSLRLHKRFYEAVHYRYCGPRQTATYASLLDWGEVIVG